VLGAVQAANRKIGGCALDSFGFFFYYYSKPVLDVHLVASRKLFFSFFLGLV
jgi:hypothetical protein